MYKMSVPTKCPKCKEEGHIIETPVNVKVKQGWCCGACGYGKNILADEVSEYERLKENKECRDEVNSILSNNPTVQKCQSLTCKRKDIFIDSCIVHLAESTNTASVCQSAQDKVSCYADLAYYTHNPSICDNVAPITNENDLTANNRDSYREGCYNLYVNGFTYESGTTMQGVDYLHRTLCEGTYGKQGPIGLDDCAPTLCTKTGGIWNQAGLTCNCQNNNLFNQINGCVISL